MPLGAGAHRIVISFEMICRRSRESRKRFKNILARLLFRHGVDNEAGRIRTCTPCGTRVPVVCMLMPLGASADRSNSVSISLTAIHTRPGSSF
jgi:hypothetical protein